MKHTPWSDVAELLTFPSKQDSQGYEFPTDEKTESERIYCDFEDGVSQSEFYRSQKAGLQASATLTMWTIDYGGEQFVRFNNKLYSVIRSFVPDFDLTTLVLSEVIR